LYQKRKLPGRKRPGKFVKLVLSIENGKKYAANGGDRRDELLPAGQNHGRKHGSKRCLRHVCLPRITSRFRRSSRLRIAEPTVFIMKMAAIAANIAVDANALRSKSFIECARSAIVKLLAGSHMMTAIGVSADSASVAATIKARPRRVRIIF